MTKQTEALKLALAALEAVNRTDLSQVNSAIAAIKEVQAEQAQQKPFGFIKPGEGDYEKVFSWNRNERTGYTQPVYTSPQPSKPWVGLDDTDLAVCDTDGVLVARYWERVLREKNA